MRFVIVVFRYPESDEKALLRKEANLWDRARVIPRQSAVALRLLISSDKLSDLASMQREEVNIPPGKIGDPAFQTERNGAASKSARLPWLPEAPFHCKVNRSH
jgi:hypothetical protein